MKYLFWFWFVPMGFFWGWFALSSNDMSFGMKFFSREVHDITFGVYSHLLKIPYDNMVSMLIKACIVDTGIIFAIFGFRRRKEIKAWWQARKAAKSEGADLVEIQPSVVPAE